jgi:hypothetical protein
VLDCVLVCRLATAFVLTSISKDRAGAGAPRSRNDNPDQTIAVLISGHTDVFVTFLQWNWERHLETLRAQIVDCERLQRAAKSRIKRDIFTRLVAHYTTLAG